MEMDMIIEILLLLALCIGVPVLIGHMIETWGRDEQP